MFCSTAPKRVRTSFCTHRLPPRAQKFIARNPELRMALRVAIMLERETVPVCHENQREGALCTHAVCNFDGGNSMRARLDVEAELWLKRPSTKNLGIYALHETCACAKSDSPALTKRMYNEGPPTKERAAKRFVHLASLFLSLSLFRNLYLFEREYDQHTCLLVVFVS